MVGSILRPNNSGLGNLGLEFYEQGIVDKCLLFSNGVFADFPERYNNALMCKSHLEIAEDEIEWLLKDIKTLLLFETPFRWGIIPKAKERGIKVVLMPMHECLPEPPYTPDLWICPSDIDFELPYNPKIRLNVPVNINKIKWQERKTAKVFIHNAGHGGLKGRNGTRELIEAMQYVKADIKLIIRSQADRYNINDNRIEFRHENIRNYQDLWNEGDVFVFPEKFNGLSLPLQEAFASGMAIITTNKTCFNWLPKDLLLDVAWEREHIAREVDSAVHNPLEIARKIDEIAGKNISKYSKAGQPWAKANSWEVLKNKYLEIL